MVISFVLMTAEIVGAPLPLPPELELDRAWPVEAPGRRQFQPSGLLLHERALWTVSDKHDATIFALDLRGGVARATEVLSGEIDPAADDGSWIDAEGLAMAPDGALLLASEARLRVFRRGVDDTVWSAGSPGLADVGASVGLFAERNAAIEGIAALDADTVIVAAEREPRGLVEFSGCDRFTRVAAQRMDTSVHPVPAGRNCDFADLATWRGRLFALARNQHVVVELVRERNGAWREGGAWSFAATENADGFRFRDRAFGLAEGLAIDDAFIYVILDNNDDVREAAPNDDRPLLFRFRNAIPR